MTKNKFVQLLLSTFVLLSILIVTNSCTKKSKDTDQRFGWNYPGGNEEEPTPEPEPEPEPEPGDGDDDADEDEDEDDPITSHLCGDETFNSDTFSVGSINGQNGWDLDASKNFDEEIVNLGAGIACRGNGVWRLSNLVASTAFGDQPGSPAFTNASGETSVKDPGGGDSMSISFFFRTVSSVADGSAFTLNFSPTGKNRLNHLRFENNLDINNGHQIYAFSGMFAYQPITPLITRGTWHHVKVIVRTIDGDSNDVVQVFLDGALVSTHTTLEDYYVSVPEPKPNMTRAMFRISGAGTTIDSSFTAPQGYYIDDFVQRSFNHATPDTFIETYSTGFEQ